MAIVTLFLKQCGYREFYFHKILPRIFNNIVRFTNMSSKKENLIYMFENKLIFN